MRIPVYLTCLLAIVLAALPVRQAKADDVSFDVFYNNLADDGDWYNTPEYGYVWHPAVADKSDKWRPYTDGYWAQTDDGWTWVSYENFGWATYHYGRWTRLKDIGWAWVPGYDWGPGWVSWRTADDYVGWAPLPPKPPQPMEAEESAAPPPSPQAAVQVDYNTIEPADYGPDVDVQYNIGPENYCFVQTRQFGAPVLAEVLVPPQQNFVIIERTVNVTNIYRPPGGPAGPGGGFVVFNRGPDFNVINARCERPIQVLRIERHDDITYLNNGIHGGGNANQVRGGVFAVAAPPIAHGPINFAQVKPVRVKQTLERTEVVHGWSNSGADPATVQRLRDHMKQQAQQATPPPRDANPPRPEQLQRARAEANQPPAPANNPPAPANANKNRPPLTPEEKAARQKPNAANTPEPGAPGANGQQPLTPEEKAARKTQRQQAKPQPGQQTPAAGQNPPPANNPPAPNPDEQGRRAQRQPEKAQPGQQPSARPEAPNPDKEARKAQRQQDQPQAQPSEPNPDKEARKAQRQQDQPPAQNPDNEARKAQRQQDQPSTPNPDKEARKAQHQQDQSAEPNPDKEARKAQRQPDQSAAPNPDKEARKAQRQPDQPQAQQPRAQQGGTPQAKGDDDKKKKKDQPDQ